MGGYLAAADQAAALLREPDVAAAWGQPSALAEMTVGGLAGHLAYQIFSVSALLDEPASEQAPIALLEHYARAVWLGAPLVRRPTRVSGPGVRTLGARGRRRWLSAQAPRSPSSRRSFRGCRAASWCSCRRRAGR